MHKKKASAFDIINIFIMIILIFVMFYPFLYMINVSLSSKLFVMKNSVTFWPRGFTLEWYKMVFGDSRIGIGYKNTIIYTILGMCISLLATSAAAFALSRPKLIFRKAIALAMVFTILFGGGMIPSFLVVKWMGMYNTIWGFILPGIISTYYILIFRTHFEGLPEDLFDSGRIDGMEEIGLFFCIAVPLSKAIYAAIGLFVCVEIWNNYQNAIIYLRDPELFPLQVVMRDLIIAGSTAGSIAADASTRSVSQGRESVVTSLKYATIMVSTLPILCTYPFLQKYFVKGVMIGAIKA